MEKLIVGTGNRWQDEAFEYKTIGIQTFSFLKVMACFESNYAKGMDKLCVAESVEDLYDELIEGVEKKVGTYILHVAYLFACQVYTILCIFVINLT